MEAQRADPRRVAARAVGRTREEHAALERMLARRRAGQPTDPRQQHQQHEVHGQTQKVRDQLQAPHLQPQRTQELSPMNLTATSGVANEALGARNDHAGVASEHRNLLDREYPQQHRLASYEEERQREEAAVQRNESRHRGDLVRGPLPPAPAPFTADDASDSSDSSDVEEMSESLHALVYGRTAIQDHPELSPLCKAVLLLVTQIPEGRFTTYAHIHQRLLNADARYFCDIHHVGLALANSPFPNSVVPCHRVVGRVTRLARDAKPQLLDLGVHCRSIRDTYMLLMNEGVRFHDNGAPIDGPFCGFWDGLLSIV
ncbi:hypothetical protein F5Y05DRAFT_362964 [Hypoxylon sp. FL0543]|nr:hypothetical protein F5Y05DRAFT_362964 [Hypoxylon sp. FL0543]